MKTTSTRLAICAAAAMTLALAACNSTPEDEPTTQGSSDAGAFVACLTAAGADAKVSDDGFVLVKQTGTVDDGLVAADGSDGALFTESDDQGNSWVAAPSSAYFTDDPDTQDAYSGCETKLPDFAQPEAGEMGDVDAQEYLDQQAKDGLEFANCARENGFAWVADPSTDGGGAIQLPADVTEDEFRSLLQSCYDPSSTLGWEPADDIGFDWAAVLMEFIDAAGVVDSATAGDDK